MPYPYHPIAQTSYPTDAQTREEEGPKSYEDHDFSWDEDWLARFRAIALFGGLVLVEGIVLWQSLVMGFNPSFPGGLLLACALLLGVCGIPATYFEASEMAMAFFGAGATGIVVAFSCAGNTIPANFSPFPMSGNFGADAAFVLGLLVGGAVLLVLGVIESLKASRELDDDIEPKFRPRADSPGGAGQ